MIEGVMDRISRAVDGKPSTTPLPDGTTVWHEGTRHFAKEERVQIGGWGSWFTVCGEAAHSRVDPRTVAKNQGPCLCMVCITEVA